MRSGETGERSCPLPFLAISCRTSAHNFCPREEETSWHSSCPPMRRVVGMDFGTTNSAIAVVGENGVPQLAHYSHEGALIETFRSILFFSSEPREAGSPIRSIRI